MSYYLLEIFDNENIKIGGNVDKFQHRYNLLKQYCDRYNFTYVNNEDEIKDSGLFCVKQSDEKFNIVLAKKEKDGWIYNGKIILQNQYKIILCYYKNSLIMNLLELELDKVDGDKLR